MMGLMRHLREAGADLLTPTNPTAAARFVEGQRLDGVVAFFNAQRKGVLPFVAGVRGSERNGRTPVYVIASEVDAESVKRLSALGVASIMVAPAGAGEVVQRLERALAAPAARPRAYDVRVINCFLAAAREVLDFYLGTPAKVGRPAVKQGNRAAGFVTGLIAFSTDSQLGSLSATFEQAFVNILAGKIFGDATTPLDEAAYADLAGEMCNQVLGKAQANLAALGIKIRMGLPEVVVGPDHVVFHKVDEPIIMIPIRTGATTCVIEFAMGRDAAAESAPAPSGGGHPC
jgi:CheY-specific phosphatase CheX